ncbi:Carbon monoxide dehydrogenase/acetyl-CoA synthase subunit alpha [subsurface metagenome]
MQVEFGGKRTVAFELLRGKSMEEVEDGKIEIVGPEVDQVEQGAALPLGILVKVAGRKFQEDFESVLERRNHEFISCANGIFHMGQRAIVWIRISKEAFNKGFRLKHLGEILIAKIHDEYSAIVDKVQVKIITDEEKMKAPLEEARKIYHERDERIGGMKDEDVDTLYSCILCQSYAPDHVCIVTPQRLGLCGAYTWLDCKASFELNPRGPNEPVKKGRCLEEVKGQWEGVNEYLKLKSHGNLARFNAYSMIEDPMTSCGCFECIAAILPETNGIMIVNREFTEMTPIGMTFSTMAGQVGGGVQTPGFIGMGKLYITSEKFISADGGIKRLVWMPKELKEEIKERLENRLAEIGESDLLDKIATEEDATASEDLVKFLQAKGHPALSMEPMM